MISNQTRRAVENQAGASSQEMRLFADPEGKTPIDTIDLGRIPVGHEKIVEAYIFNMDKRWPITRIRLTKEDPDLRVEFPKFLMAGERARIRIIFTPGLMRREPLDINDLFIGELWIG